MFDRWQSEGKGVRVGGSPLTAARHQPSPPLHQAETADYLTNVTWADDFILIASSKAALGEMVEDFLICAEEQSLIIQWDKIEFWSLRRPETMRVRRGEIDAKQDMQFLGLSIVTGGGPTG